MQAGLEGRLRVGAEMIGAVWPGPHAPVPAMQIATKTPVGKLKALRSLLNASWRRRCTSDSGRCHNAATTLRHGHDAERLSGARRAPVDRMLAAQAQAEHLGIDPAFEALGRGNGLVATWRNCGGPTPL
jgi:hypothetical protein